MCREKNRAKVLPHKKKSCRQVGLKKFMHRKFFTPAKPAIFYLKTGHFSTFSRARERFDDVDTKESNDAISS